MHAVTMPLPASRRRSAPFLGLAGTRTVTAAIATRAYLFHPGLCLCLEKKVNRRAARAVTPA
jgi:hypothetical protein